MHVMVHAQLRNLRISEKKVRLVVDIIRGLSAASAAAQLSAMNKQAAKPVAKLLASAVANAQHNFHADKESLRVATVMVDKGSMLYRYMPRARGTAAPLRRRFCHVKIVLAGTAPDAVATPEVTPAVEAPKS